MLITISSPFRSIMIQYLIIMKYSIILTFASSLLIYDSTCYGDACQINGLSQEELKISLMTLQGMNCFLRHKIKRHGRHSLKPMKYL